MKTKVQDRIQDVDEIPNPVYKSTFTPGKPLFDFSLSMFMPFL